MKKTNLYKNCIICSTLFKVKPCHLDILKTCSKECNKKNKSLFFKTIERTKEWKQKIGKANAIALLGKTTSEKQKEVARSRRGEKNPNWKGGKMQKSYRVRKLQSDGSHTKVEWENLKEKYGYMCLCCKQTEPIIKLSRDHIIPLSKGGTDYISNIQPLCLGCNKRKATKHIDYQLTINN